MLSKSGYRYYIKRHCERSRWPMTRDGHVTEFGIRREATKQFTQIVNEPILEGLF